MKIAVVGSRGFNDYEVLSSFINSVCDDMNINIDTIISGGAKGADKLGERYAKENNIPIQLFIPDWDKYGKAAGFIRNVDIIKSCDVCFAFWDGQSHGTQHDIDLCKEHNKTCYIYRY